MRCVIPLVAALGAVMLSGCASPRYGSNAGDAASAPDKVVTYGGPVQPLTEPVQITRRAWPSVLRVCDNFQIGRQPFTLPAEVAPRMTDPGSGRNTCRSIATTAVAGGQRITFTDDKGVQSTFTRSNSGVLSNFSVRGAANATESVREFENEMHGMAMPRRRVAQGDVLTVVTPDSSYRQSCRVTGRTTYETRQALVTECETEQTTPSGSMRFTGQGYILFDIETGVYLLFVERQTAYDGTGRPLGMYSRKIERLD